MSLTTEQIEAVYEREMGQPLRPQDRPTVFRVARAIEAVVKESERAVLTERPEPVAWLHEIVEPRWRAIRPAEKCEYKSTPLFATPAEPAAPPAVRLDAPSDEQILHAATSEFPRWREDIQEQFVLRVVRAALARSVPGEAL